MRLLSLSLGLVVIVLVAAQGNVVLFVATLVTNAFPPYLNPPQDFAVFPNRYIIVKTHLLYKFFFGICSCRPYGRDRYPKQL